MDAITPVVVQASFRGRDDDQTLNSATFDYALNADWTQLVDAAFRIRYVIQETAGGEEKNETYSLEYNKNSAGWNSVTLASANIQIENSSQYTAGSATTQVIGSGTFTACDGVEDPNTASGLVTLLSNETEIEYCLTIVSADVVDGDTIEVRAVNGNGALDSYTNTPTITADKPVGATPEATQLDGLAVIKSKAAPQVDGLAVIKSKAAPQVDGQVIIKSASELQLDGYGDVLYVSSPVAFDGDVTTQWDEPAAGAHYDDVDLIATGSDSTFIRTTAASDIDEFTVGTTPANISSCEHVVLDLRGIITDGSSSAVIAVSLWVSGAQQGSTQYVSGTDFAAYGTRGTAPSIRFENVNLTQAQCNALQVRFQALTAAP